MHHAEDKCAFIRANCPDEEAGLFSYLTLYYCDLNNVHYVAFTILALWLGLLFTTIGIAASDFFCINLSTIASILGMSESMAGVTFLAFGNGSPDVFSTFAAMSSHSGSLAIGELIGAAGFITAVVAGSMALVREFKVGKKTFVRDVGFFIVAASFSMIFLADGYLHLWECCVMIGFYLFYVVIVVVWHWYLGRRRKRREQDAAARGHYLATSNEEIEVAEEDVDDEDAPAGERRYRDVEDFEALERSSSPAFGQVENDESDEDGGDQGKQLAAEMAASMRVTRPKGVRRNTMTPIRPSLVGALEFRSVLSSLQKSRGSHSSPIHLRRYSDDPNATAEQLGGQASRLTPYSDDPNVTISQPEDLLSIPPKVDAPARLRAVSMNDAGSPRPKDPAAFSVADVPDVGLVAATPTFPRLLEVPGEGSSNPLPNFGPLSPTISVTPPTSTRGGSRDPSPAPSQGRQSYDSRLAPPDEGFPGARHLREDLFRSNNEPEPNDTPHDSPKTRSRAVERPRLQIPNKSRESSHTRTVSPVLQFPTYTESPVPLSSRASRPPSLLLPDAILTPESSYPDHCVEFQERRIKWWPYRILPSPYTLVSTLFPTLCTWRDKSTWDKIVSTISAPSIFLLAITLPVVEPEAQEEPQEELARETRRMSTARSRSGTVPLLTPDSPSLEEEPEWMHHQQATEAREPTRSPHLRGFNGHSTAAIAISTENLHHHLHSVPVPTKQNSVDHVVPSIEISAETPRDWNRWLVSVQIFTAPLFVVIIVWANTDARDPRFLVKMILYSLLGSLLTFGILVLTTTPNKPPKYRFLFCFIGFVVSIAWISTIANEVVGVLKAFGVILGISDAILGLTIFAVGNSLGDLVADVTVARLGYPVMALSACFGGPMLNILLGIGVSGLYMTIKEANSKHVKHPGKKLKYKPYQIEVSGTLMVSGITLLVTLVGLLIAVPMNKWIMSRRIGWGLIILWSISTVVNLAVELSGVWGDTSSVW